MKPSGRTVALVGPELYPIPPIRGGAVELFIEKVAHQLTGWRPVIIGVGDPDLPRHEVRGRVEYYRLPLTGWRRWLYKRHRRHFPVYDRQVAAVIEQVAPALVHVHNRPLLASSLLERLPPEVPIILHLHNLYESLGKRERPVLPTTLPVAGFLACSHFVLERERDRLGRGAATYGVVYNGVDIQAFASLWEHPELVRQIRARHGLTDEPTVLFAGKLRASKGVHLVVRAMNRVWRAMPEAVLVLVGGTEFGRGRLHRRTPFFRDLEREMAMAAGRIILTGFIPPEEMPRTYLLGDLFVGPSQIDEGLGLVFLEAAAVGLPLIATPRGGIPEIVREGENGLLLEHQDDPRELADKILLLLKDEQQRKRLGQQGRDLVRANFSWEKIAQDLEKVYDELVGGRGEGPETEGSDPLQPTDPRSHVA
jgi:spore coat protein SA